MHRHNLKRQLSNCLNKNMLTKNDIADILSVSLSTVNNYLGFEEGKLRFIKLNSSNKSTIRILKDDFINFISERYDLKDK